MTEELITHIIYSYSYPILFLLTLVYFSILYFVLAPTFLYACKGLKRLGLVNQISPAVRSTTQLKFEIKHSFHAIIIFGFSVIPIIFLIRTGTITLSESTITNTIVGLLLLIIWNEVHFFIIHRFMHTPFFMRTVHHIHHASKVPSVYSVYSFHWFEAFLLSTVPLTILPFINLSSLAIFLFPIVSILLNFAGHANYRFGKGHSANWTLFGTKHHAHHQQFSKNYGFASGLLDKLCQMTISKINQQKK